MHGAAMGMQGYGYGDMGGYGGYMPGVDPSGYTQMGRFPGMGAGGMRGGYGGGGY